MPIEIKELIVRAWVNSDSTTKKHEGKKVSKNGAETSEFHAQMLEQLKRMLTDKIDR
jgi:hypothetical protein